MHIDAVTTVVAVGGDGDLVKLGAVFSLSGHLPGVLTTVGEDGVGSGDVVATLVSDNLPSVGLVRHVNSREDSLAKLLVVLELDELRSQGVHLGWGLEPSVFGTRLVSPRSASGGDVDLLGDNIGARATVVAKRVVTTCNEGVHDRDE